MTVTIMPGVSMWYATFAFTVMGLGKPQLVTVVKVGRGKVKVRWDDGGESWVKAANLYPVKEPTHGG